jgi:hypothetical protein
VIEELGRVTRPGGRIGALDLDQGSTVLDHPTVAILLGINEPMSVWTAVATLPIFAWEFSLGLWLAFKGTSTAQKGVNR